VNEATEVELIEQQEKPELVEPGFFHRPEADATIPPSSREEMDAALTELQASKEAWVTLSLDERVRFLDQILEDLASVTEWWISDTIKAKGIEGNDFAEAEEWATLAIVFRYVRLLRRSLIDIQRYGRPQIPGRVTTRPDGQVVAKVFPQSRFDGLVLQGTTAEVWMEPGVTVDEVYAGQARHYQESGAVGKVSLVLGAGNASNLVPVDFLHKLFVERQVAILKMNPVNAYLGPIVEKGFQALKDQGYLRIVYGGAAEGDYLCHHPMVEEIHLTGSDKTYEAIVFGTGPEGKRRKAECNPRLQKRFTAELGNVTPVIVVPGPWTANDIEAQGERLARWLVVNSGFNCLTPRVILQWEGWGQKTALNQAIGEVLRQVETRKAYYPGARQRQAQFVTAHPDAREFGAAEGDHLPWTFITGLDAESGDEICFQNEAFCGLFAETSLEAPSIAEFLDRAVAFVNEMLWGNLTATLVVHPKSLEDDQVAAAVDQAIANLRYGMVLVNQFGGLGYYTGTTTWGSYPGNEFNNIQSGIGVTLNPLMFERPQKSVVRSPFRLSPDPLSLTSRTAKSVGARLVTLERNPSLWQVPGMLWDALRS
jgi:acyl-CoA reductase-like NAD-dependent aldehyde dehydrogenase